MKKGKYWLIIVTVILIFLAAVTGLFYWKLERIIQSVSESAKKASSQNTPLLDE